MMPWRNLFSRVYLLKVTLPLLIVASVLFSSVGAVAHNSSRYLFLCFGQSNMEGFPGIEEEDRGPVDERFQMLAAVDFPQQEKTKGSWYPAVPPLCRPSTGLCPADYFGRTLVAGLPKNIRIGIVNVSVAGGKIELFERDTFQTYAATAPKWMIGTIASYSGNPSRDDDMAVYAGTVPVEAAEESSGDWWKRRARVPRAGRFSLLR